MKFFDHYIVILIVAFLITVASWTIGMVYFGGHTFSFNSQDWANFSTFVTGISSVGAAFISILILRKTLQQQSHQLKIDNLRADIEKLERSIVENWFYFEFELSGENQGSSIPYFPYFESMYRNRIQIDKKAIKVIPDLIGNFVLLLKHVQFYISEYKKIENDPRQKESLEVTVIAYWQSSYRFKMIVLFGLANREGIDLKLTKEDREILEYFVLI